MTAFIYLYIFIIGIVVGSFLNVVIYRLPNEQSIVRPRSYCPSCQKTLTWQQLIPIVSYLIQGGKCANCGSRVSLQYPMIEFLTGLLFMLVYFVQGMTWLTVVYWVLTACFIVITMIDWKHMIIPDEINLFLFILGILVTVFGVTIPIKEALLGSLLGGGILWGLAVVSKGGMGGGDIKFAFAIGLFTGWKLMFLLLFLASLIGCVFGVALILRHGYQKGKPIPFGPFLVMAAFIVLLWGQQFLDYYISLF